MPKRSSASSTSSSVSVKRKRDARVELKTALSNGALIKRVTIEDNDIYLDLAKIYDTPKYYAELNQLLFDWHAEIDEFWDVFSCIELGEHPPVLRWINKEKEATTENVMLFLMECAKRQVIFPVRRLLKEGKLLKGATIEGNQVTLVFHDEVDAQHYKNINLGFYSLYRSLPLFQAQFERPNVGPHAPTLMLRARHSYTTGAEEVLLAALIAFAAPTEKPLKFKASLRKGKLI